MPDALGKHGTREIGTESNGTDWWVFLLALAETDKWRLNPTVESRHLFAETVKPPPRVSRWCELHEFQDYYDRWFGLLG